jgi:nucleoside triphosphate pyrophosphatase
VKPKSLVLASGSPRRIELLSDAGFRFEIVRPTVSEKTDPHLTARELTGWNALRKGMEVAKRYPRDIVLAADTVVAFNDEIIGKPNDLTDAVRILRRLNGQTHHVYSSVFISHLAAGRVELFCELSQVHFLKLNQSQIRSYLAKIDPLDKAGAYAAQGHGAEIVERIDGSYSNVVGLPMEQTITALRKFGIYPTRTPPSPLSPARPVPGRALWVFPSATRGKGTKR